MQDHDTIAAIATAPGEAGISIIRVSGSRAFAIADKLFRGPLPSSQAANTITYGHMTGVDGDIDEIMLAVFRAPHSYTCEDVVEFQGHGGSITARRILNAVLEAGARLADPGEFTKRAFLAGRIDLVQAEAVMDLISARSQRAAAAAVEQIEGRLSTTFKSIYHDLITVAADLEACLDFDEDDAPPNPGLSERLSAALQALAHLAKSWEEGHRLREGALVVIAGKPNAGKSTLMNALLGIDRSIVTDIPGTTRDSLEEQIVLQGYPLRLVDTAGLRDADCVIEQEGVKRSQKLMNNADVILYLIDAYELFHDDGQVTIPELDPEKSIIVINKIDLVDQIDCEPFKDYQPVYCSLKHGEGLTPLKQALTDRLHLQTETPAAAAISERHLAGIQSAMPHIKKAMHLLRETPVAYESLAAIELRGAIETLGKITGQVYYDDLLEQVFARFCVGK